MMFEIHFILLQNDTTAGTGTKRARLSPPFMVLVYTGLIIADTISASSELHCVCRW
jgi:hypothetical protein